MKTALRITKGQYPHLKRLVSVPKHQLTNDSPHRLLPSHIFDMGWLKHAEKSRDERLAENIRLVGPEIAAVCAVKF